MTIGPVLMAVYGSSGRGKTVASIRAFSAGFFIGPQNSFLPANTFLGIDLGPKREIVITKFSDLFPWFEKIAASKTIHDVVISDVSILLEAEYKHIRKPKSDGGMGIIGWDTYTEIERQFGDALEIIRALPQNFVLEFHETPAKTVNKTGKVESSVFIPACPQVPGQRLPGTLPGYFDIVAQVVMNPEDSIGKFIWPFCLSVAPTENAARKDRDSVFPAYFPMNIREPLMLNGRTIERHESVKWLDDAIEPVANSLFTLKSSNELTKETVRELLNEVVTTHKTRDMKHVRWLINDAFDRAEVRLHKQKQTETLIDNILKGL